jgi:hypothetical protein
VVKGITPCYTFFEQKNGERVSPKQGGTPMEKDTRISEKVKNQIERFSTSCPKA